MNRDPRNERGQAIRDLVSKAKLDEVVTWLGQQVIGRGTQSPKTLCPFHDDRRPSMQLFSGNGNSHPHFHCFSCGAHGDVFDLIKRIQGGDFKSALYWLAEKYRIAIPQASASFKNRDTSRSKGLSLGHEIYSKISPQEAEALKSWAISRGFDPVFLKNSEIFAALSPKISNSSSIEDREIFDQLEEAGLLLRRNISGSGETKPLYIDLPPRDFYNTPRIIFTIRNDRGNIVGFAGRAIGNEQPKYLFTKGFPKGETLYRFEKVRALSNQKRKKSKTVHLYLVEGLLDALRLESLGLNSVAILGSQITANQVELLKEFANELDREERQLIVHVFLDTDEAGKRGSAAATIKLLDACAITPGLISDNIIPHSLSNAFLQTAHDPDELLRNVESVETANVHLAAWCYSPMQTLLAKALDVSPVDLVALWNNIRESQKIQAFRDVERRLDRSKWIDILDRVPAFDSHVDGSKQSQSLEWEQALQNFLRASRNYASTLTHSLHLENKNNESRLIRALQVAEASTQRREFPIDEGSWERLLSTIDATTQYIRDLLSNIDSKSILDSDNYLAVLVPKGKNQFRFKALPSPESLVMQQYLLNEILRGYIDCPRFSQLIPAIRYTSNEKFEPISTTGYEHIVPLNGETVSFAYIIDMDVVEHRTPPRRTGMFRPYYQCWQHFISYIDNRIATFPPGNFHVARLDIRSFYNSVSRTTINSVLLPPLIDALSELKEVSETGDALDCASYFRPQLAECNQRARSMVDWLCDQSFRYEYDPPSTLNHHANANGLPQGPDLSAYLANISLFPLDRKLSEVVADIDRKTSESQRAKTSLGQELSFKGAVYARYVDDMVIIARTASDLSLLRNSIEQQLAQIGLELNPKNDPLPIMSEGEVRAWLTDHRGGGLGASGPFERPPGNSPLSMLEPLADAGETDRSDSLQILYDPRLTAPNIPIDFIHNAISVALAAPELRHNDRVNAARLLLRSVIQQFENNPISVEVVADHFLKLWNSGNRKPASPEQSNNVHGIAELFAWLDGIERLLTVRTDRNPGYSSQQHEILRDQRICMANLVHNGICDKLISSISNSEQVDFRNSLELKCLVLFRLAALISPKDQYKFVSVSSYSSRAKQRLLISLAEAQGNTELLDRAEFRASNTSLVLLFHEAIARLRIAQKSSANSFDNSRDPLQPMSNSLAVWAQRGSSARSIENILLAWMPHETIDIRDDKILELALNAICNLAPSIVVDLVERRPSLKLYALGENTLNGIRLIPTPPGMGVPGLLGYRDLNKQVIRTDFRSVENQHFSPALEWNNTNSSQDGSWKRSVATLTSGEYLPPGNSLPEHAHITRWLAHAYRSLASKHVCFQAGYCCPPTACNLLGPDIDSQTYDSSWDILGFCVESKRVAGQAFLRFANGGLILQPVLENHDYLWRVGTALADWLGRADATRQLSSQRLSAPALIYGAEENWALEAMLRFSLCRLRGISLPARPLRLSQDSGLPLTIERVLKRLEEFPTNSDHSTSFSGLTHLFATLSESRAMRARIDLMVDIELPGGPTAILTEIVRTLFRSDEELAIRLPNSGASINIDFPKRRPARAYYGLSQRMAILASMDSNEEDITLKAIAAGTRLLCVESQLRSQALELWSLLGIEARNNFVLSPPSLSAWNLDSTAILTRDQAAPRAANSAGEWANTKTLFQKLHYSTCSDDRIDWGALSNITALGWYVVLGTLIDISAAEWRGGFIDPNMFDESDINLYKSMALKLAANGDDSDDLPWGGLQHTITEWDEDYLNEVLKTLSHIDIALNIVVSTHESHRFYLESTRRNNVEVSSSDGRRIIPGWSVNYAATVNEHRDGIERVDNPSHDGKIIYRWSESWRNDRLIGIGVVQPGLVALAGKSFSQVTTSPISREHTLTAKPIPATEVNNNKNSAEEPGKKTQQAAKIQDDLNENNSSIKFSDGDDFYHQSSRIRSAFEELKILQEESWRKRSEKAQSHARIALLQWDLDDSYYHPYYDICRELIDDSKKNASDWNNHSYEGSCAEERRRRILTVALEACKSFKVDVLLLPEYSVRPDTIEWIKNILPTLAPITSIWAGTYRLPPHSVQGIPYKEWSAVHKVIFPDRDSIDRAKRYPAPAATEVFNPGSQALEPLFQAKLNGDQVDIRSYLYELICSEVFLVTNPANLRPMARVRRQLLRKFNLAVNGQDLDRQIRDDDIIEDILHFAKATALSEGLGIRRTILLVPAMTSRAADYSVLGQAGYLASSLTTVFCNAVCGEAGNGQSCFIGHDGWLDTKEHDGCSSLEPYHGVRPGIWHLDAWRRGRLGKKEQALVIADIDPVYGAEGKPRPQMLLKPLQLVAHLPLVQTVFGYPSVPSPKCPRCIRQRKADSGSFAIGLIERLNHGIQNQWVTTSNDDNPKLLADQLNLLADSDKSRCNTDESNSGWLSQRSTAYLQKHIVDPQPWPPPAALDWIWLNLGPVSPSELPKIEVPPYRSV